MANSRTPPADIAPPKHCKKPANAKAMSPLWRMSPQTCMAQNFCFFVFGNQHGATLQQEGVSRPNKSAPFKPLAVAGWQITSGTLRLQAGFPVR
jgi:hypothetical protein